MTGQISSDMLEFLTQEGGARHGSDFLKALASHLGQSLDVDYVLIDRLSGDPNVASIIACYTRDGSVLEGSYRLEGTPCENVIGKSFCLYPSGVRGLFPNDTVLADMSAESYVGLPLWGSRGNALGLIAAIDRKPMISAEPVATVMRLAAARAATEIERHGVEVELARSSAYNRGVTDASPDAMFVVDTLGRVIDVNDAAEELTGSPRAELVHQALSTLLGDARVLRRAIPRALSGDIIRGIELPVRPANARSRPSALSGARFCDEYGAPLGVIVTVRDVSDRKKLERRIQRVAIEERKRLAVELHDSVGQQLTGLAYLLHSTARDLAESNPGAATDLKAAAHIAMAAISSCRSIARGLAPLVEFRGELLPALAYMAERLNELGGPRFCTIVPGVPLPALEPMAADHLYGIAQEACSNALRHSGATTVTLRLECIDDVVVLTIDDDGVGFSWDSTEARSGFGTKTLTFRADLIGADIDIGPGKDSGTRVRCQYRIRTSETAVQGD